MTAVGNAVSRYAVGDLVGVGCMVDSCQQCEECAEGLENYCDHMVLTYNGPTQTRRDTRLAVIHSRSWSMNATCCG